MSNAESSPAAAGLSEAKRRLLENYRRGYVSKTAGDPTRITRRPPGHPAPLSLWQEQVWLRAQKAADMPPFYNESIIMHRSGPLEAQILEQSLSEIIRRHEAWRTTFDTLDGQPVQIIHSALATFSLPVVDLREMPAEKRQAEALRLGTEETRSRFDLEKGPLVRAELIVLSADKHQLVLTMHQSVADGVTVNVLFPKELITLYEAFSASRPAAMAELPIQYADYAYWQRRQMETGAWASQIAYWREQLMAPPPPLRWATGHTETFFPNYLGAIRP